MIGFNVQWQQKLFSVFAVILLLSSPVVCAQVEPQYKQLSPISLGDISAEQQEIWFGEDSSTVRNVSQATLTPFIPQKPNGSAVIIAPGGGFLMLSMESEGWQIARRLSAKGITAFVLKYRLRATPENAKDFNRALGQLFTSATKGQVSPYPAALEDGKKALQWLQKNVQNWYLDTNRVGLLGFSAGAMVVLNTAVDDGNMIKPAFVAPIYGPVNEVVLPVKSMPLFIAMAADDPLFGNHGFALVSAWKKARYPLEFHLYEDGGHGFGAGKPGTSSEHWLGDFEKWLIKRDFISL